MKLAFVCHSVEDAAPHPNLQALVGSSAVYWSSGEKRMQRRFTRKHLARQPFMDFQKAKTLLNMGSLQRKRLLRQKNIHISAGPMKAAVPAAAAASPGGNKRKRSSNPSRRQQPGMQAVPRCMHAVLLYWAPLQTVCSFLLLQVNILRCSTTFKQVS